MPLATFDWKPGVNKDDTPSSAEGGWTDADKIRFVRGRPQTIGGWDAATAGTFSGIARGGVAWADQTGRRYAAWGTAAGLYVLAGSDVLTITPAHSSGVLNNPFTVASGSASVTVNHPDHTFVTGQTVTYSNQQTSVGGLTLSGSYTVTVSDADTYTVTAGGTASSTQTSGGGHVDYTSPLPAGLTDTLGDPGGYGSGAYSEGAYSGSATATATGARLWFLDNWGDHLLAVPRGGALYEYQPAISYPELVTNGTFATSAGWVTGTGWSIGAGVATAASGTASSLSRPVALTGGKVYELSVTLTLGTPGTSTIGAGFATTSGSDIVTATYTGHGLAVGDVFVIASATALNGVTLNGTWTVHEVIDANTFTFQALQTASGSGSGGGAGATISYPQVAVKADTGLLGGASAAMRASGTYTRLFRAPAGAVDLVFAKSAHFAGTLDNVSVTLADTAFRIDEAPYQNDAMFVDPHRIVVLLGTSLYGDVYNALAVRGCDRENLTDWTPTPANMAFDYLLAVGSRTVGGIVTRSQNLIWTDSALYTMSFTGVGFEPFRFELAGTGCGLAAPLARAERNGTVFWASKGDFFLFQGAVPQPIPSALRRDVFENVSDGQWDKIVAGINSDFSEVWWFYPDARDGNECSRYVAFNFAEGHWTCGTFARSTWINPGVFEHPIALGTDGMVYLHEIGKTAGGGVMTSFLAAADADLDDGENLMTIRRIVPDFEEQTGPVAITLTLKSFPNGAETVKGPFTASENTEKIDLRTTARQIRIRLAGSSSPSFWRLGRVTFDVLKNGAKR